MKKFFTQIVFWFTSFCHILLPFSSLINSNIARLAVAGVATASFATGAHAQSGSRVCAYATGNGIGVNPAGVMQGYVRIWYYENDKYREWMCLMMLGTMNHSFGAGGIVVSALLRAMMRRIGISEGQQWTAPTCERFTTEVLRNPGWIGRDVCNKTHKDSPYIIIRWDSGHVQMYEDFGSHGARISPY